MMKLHKKTAIATFLCIATFANTYSQKFYIGVDGGFLKNTMIMEDFSNTPHYLQFSRDKKLLNTRNWGVNLGYRLSKHWSVETQLQFTNISFKETVDVFYHFQSGGTVGTWAVEVDWFHYYHYTRIPLLAHYNFCRPQSLFGLGLIAGPDFGFLTKQSSTYKGINYIQENINFNDIPLKNKDWGFRLGARVYAKLYKSIALSIQGTVYQGFTSIIDYPEKKYGRFPAYYDDLNMVNRYFTFNIGLQYSFSVQ